jgi:hypothetical protein
MTAAYADDSDLTEITILPDGRLYVFGLSEEIRDLLRLFQPQQRPEAAQESPKQEICGGRRT